MNTFQEKQMVDPGLIQRPAESHRVRKTRRKPGEIKTDSRASFGEPVYDKGLTQCH